MADTYEKDLAQKSSLTTSDYIRVVGSDNVSYKQLVSNVAGVMADNAPYSGIQTITLQNATAGSNQSFYYKVGNVVTFFFDLTPSTSGSTVTVFTFPSGYRPPTSIRYTLSPVSHASASSIGTAYAVVGSGGTTQFYMGTAQRVFLSGSFAVA